MILACILLYLIQTEIPSTLDQANQVSLQQGAQLLKRVLDAHGGPNTIEQVRSIRIETLYQREYRRRVATRKVEVFQLAKPFYVQRFGDSLIEGFDGETPWIRFRQNQFTTAFQPPTPTIVEARHTWASQLLVLLSGSFPSAWLGEVVEGGQTEKIRVFDPETKLPIVDLFVLADGHVARMDDLGGGRIFSTYFEDYQHYGDLILPSKAIQKGDRPAVKTITSLIVNPVLPAKVFQDCTFEEPLLHFE